MLRPGMAYDESNWTTMVQEKVHRQIVGSGGLRNSPERTLRFGLMRAGTTMNPRITWAWAVPGSDPEMIRFGQLGITTFADGFYVGGVKL